MRERCGSVTEDARKIKRAESVKKVLTEENRLLAKIRNGVEGYYPP